MVDVNTGMQYAARSSSAVGKRSCALAVNATAANKMIKRRYDVDAEIRRMWQL